MGRAGSKSVPQEAFLITTKQLSRQKYYDRERRAFKLIKNSILEATMGTLESDTETKKGMIHNIEIRILFMMFIGGGYQETTECQK